MKCLYHLCLIIAAGLGLQLAVLLVPMGAASPTADSPLDRCLPAILRDPFPSPDIQARLAEGMGRAVEESNQRRERHLREFEASQKYDPNAEHHFMGWTVSDEAYWSRVPPAARNLPVDLSRLPCVRFTNTEV